MLQSNMNSSLFLVCVYVFSFEWMWNLSINRSLKWIVIICHQSIIMFINMILAKRCLNFGIWNSCWQKRISNAFWSNQISIVLLASLVHLLKPRNKWLNYRPTKNESPVNVCMFAFFAIDLFSLLCGDMMTIICFYIFFLA